MEQTGPPPGSGPEYYLQNYRLGRTLGIGSFGKVKVAEHTLTGHQVAIKILNRKKIQSMDMEEKVRREIKILKLFMHPHIIRLYEVIDTPTDIYVIMEYVQCGELFDYIVEKGRLLEDSARRFFQQILSGVEYCHRNMVVHRDLKPENLLLDAKHHVKIADFGLSNVMRDGHFLKTSCGSPNYAAPEVISGKLYAGPEVDVWSCGVILYALLCGSLPFDDENIPNLFKKIKNGIYTLPNHLSSGARDLIPRMLLVDPMKRITIPEIRQHPWFTTHLPRYLAVMQADTIMTAPRIDPEILEDVVKRGFDKEAVIESLTTRGQSKATVMYHLLLDQSRQIPNSGYLGGELSEASAAQLTGMFLPTTPSQSSTSKSETSSQHRRVTQRQWRLGGQLKGGPATIMSKLHSILRANGVVWKKLGPYSIRCRKSLEGDSCSLSSGLMEAEDSEVSSGEDRNLKDAQKAQDQVLKFEIQMYKVKEEEFALDFQVKGARNIIVSWHQLPAFLWNCYRWAVHCCYSVLAALTLWTLAVILYFGPDMGSGVLATVAAFATLIICMLAYRKTPRCCLDRATNMPNFIKERNDQGSPMLNYGTYYMGRASTAKTDAVFIDM